MFLLFIGLVSALDCNDHNATYCFDFNDDLTDTNGYSNGVCGGGSCNVFSDESIMGDRSIVCDATQINVPAVAVGKSNNQTISLWVKFRNASNDGVRHGLYAHFFHKDIAGSQSHRAWFWNQSSTGINKIQAYDQNPTLILDGAVTLDYDNFHLLTFVYHRIGALLELYIDGNLNQSNSLSIGTYGNDDMLLCAGFNGGYYLNAYVDQVVVYNSTRSAGQIMDDYLHRFPDAFVPDVNITYPANETYFNSPSINKTDINITLNFNHDNCSLQHNLTGIYTEYSRIPFPVTTFQYNFSPNTFQAINYYIYCYNGTYNASSEINYLTYNTDFTPPSISIIPSNDSHHNQDLDINITTNEKASCSVNNSAFSYSSGNATFKVYEESILGNADFIFNISCWDDSKNNASLIWYLTKDKISPTITWTFPVKTNISSAFLNDSINIDITGADNNLYAYEILIYDDNMDLRHNFTLENLPGSPYNVLKSITPDRLGNWTVKTTFSDSHTEKEFDKEKKTKIDVRDYNKKVIFKLPKKDKDYIKDNITIYYKGAYFIDSFSSTKLKDRYTFNYDFDIPKGISNVEHSFKVICEDIIYMQNSQYRAHFICNKEFWVDFENKDILDYDVTKCGQNCYDIDLIMRPVEHVAFNSIGGLNFNTEYAIFEVIELNAPNRPFFIDLTTMSGILLVFIIMFFYVALLFIGIFFDNSGFFGFGIVIGFGLSMMLYNIHVLFCLAGFLFNIIIMMTGIVWKKK